MNKIAAKLNTYIKVPFDYGAVSDALADRAKQAVLRIRQHHRNASIEIGRELLAMKEELDHGLFLRWVEAEFDFGRRTAVNLMQVAAEFGDKWETVSHLPSATVYQLASPSTPPAVREAVVESGRAGKYVSPASIKTIISQAKKPRKTRASTAERQAQEEKWQKRWEKEEAEGKALRAANAVAAEKAYRFAQKAMGDEYPAFQAMVAELEKKSGIRELIDRLLGKWGDVPTIAA